VVIFSWTSHAAMVSFSSTCPESGEAIVPGSCRTSGGSCAALDDLPVTEGEYYTALIVYPVIGTCCAPCEAVESEHYFALQLFAVVPRTHAPAQSRVFDHF
jgi:hypothetical protein